jgi:hypothetical protein
MRCSFPAKRPCIDLNNAPSFPARIRQSWQDGSPHSDGASMLIKQYVVALPADYDMSIIRRRIAEKSAAFDTLPGLGAKVFLLRERGVCGAQANQYAPVYLWPSIEPMWGFVATNLFKGILDSFGWTPIRSWPALAFARKHDDAGFHAVRSVSRETVQIAPESDLAALRRDEIEHAKQAVSNHADLIARAVGVNMEDWSLVRFDYWRCEQRDLPADAWSYEVVHVSAPNVDALIDT